MRTNQELRRSSKSLLSGNWTTAIIITVLCLMVSGVFSLLGQVDTVLVTVLCFAVNICIISPLSVGVYMTYLYFVRGEQLKAENLLGVFTAKYYKRTVILILLLMIYIVLWTLLFFVPGIIKGLSYYLAPFILIDNPEMSAEEAICQSMRMMKGHKMDLFLLQLGMLGYCLLSILLLGIPLLWIIPYYPVVYTNFYEDIKREYSEEVA